MSTIGGDYSDFDPAEAAEIELRTQEREAANRLLCEQLPALARAFAQGAARLDCAKMRTAISEIGRLTEPPAHAPLLRQLCFIVVSHLEAGIGPWRARRLARLLTEESQRLVRGEPFASRELVVEARLFRERPQRRSRLADALRRLVSRPRIDA